MRQSISNEYLTGLLFVLPWIAGFFIWILFPLGYSVYLSFCTYDGLTAPLWVGTRNYTRLASDEQFWKSLWNTVYITFIGVPVGLFFSLCLAFALNQKRRGISVYRTIIYLPCLTPVVAMAVLWMWLLNPEVGLVNALLRKTDTFVAAWSAGMLRVPIPGWLNDPLFSKPALILMGLWGAGGTMLIFLAALQDVPLSLFESAEIDGAGWFHKQLHVTLPLISPVLFYNILVGVIGGFQYFTQSYVISSGTGAPQDSTLFYALYLFNNAFPFWKMGYASAMAWILFFITLGISFVVFRLSARHIHYQGE
ncbi:MAG: sugar ABC transporter permease [bacterium]|nr:sugar ABC transporter permease [Candidatus Sumerlaeota bacterium]